MSDETKRTTAEPPPGEQRPPISDKKRNALLRYMAVLFGVAFLLVLLSFLIQLRDSRETISDLHQSNTSALQNAVRLQEENQVLATANEELTAQVETYRSDLDDAREAQDRLSEEKAALEQQLAEAQQTDTDRQSAYDLLLQAQQTAAAGDLETLAAQLSELAPLETLLSEEAYAQYEILQGLLTAETGTEADSAAGNN